MPKGASGKTCDPNETPAIGLLPKEEHVIEKRHLEELTALSKSPAAVDVPPESQPADSQEAELAFLLKATLEENEQEDVQMSPVGHLYD